MKAGPKALTAAKVRAVLRKAGYKPTKWVANRSCRALGKQRPGYRVEQIHGGIVVTAHGVGSQSEKLMAYTTSLRAGGVDAFYRWPETVICRGYLPSPEGGAE